MSPSPSKENRSMPRPVPAGLDRARRGITLRVSPHSDRMRVLRRRLERQRMTTESWRDMLGIAVVMAFVCSVASTLLMGVANPLTMTVFGASTTACLVLAVPTALHFRRWDALRRRLHSEAR